MPDMSSTSSVLLESVVPALGAIISTLMYAAPLKAVVKAASSKCLGDLNPIPFSVTVANTIVWLAYGLLKHDPYITAPNFLGVVMAVFATVTAYGLADEQVRHRVRLILCFISVGLPLLGVITVFGYTDLTAQQSLWGLAGNAICLVYYGAPLSTMSEVIRTRNSSSILLPLTLMNLANAMLWTTYGVAVADLYVWLPNGIGALLSLAQLALSLMFPARPVHGSSLDRSHAAGEYMRTSDEESEPMLKH